MKKMVFSLALLLGGAGSVLAQVNADKVNHAVARNSKVNQMFVTTNAGDVKYYNTADLASMMLLSEKSTLPSEWSRVRTEVWRILPAL